MHALALTLALATPTPQPGQRSRPAPIHWGSPLAQAPMLKPLWSREFPRNAQTPRIAFARTTNVILVLTDHLYGIDPHSGATRWTRPNLGEPVAAAGRYIVATR